MRFYTFVLAFFYQSAANGNVFFSVNRPSALGSAGYTSTFSVVCEEAIPTSLCQIVATDQDRPPYGSIKLSKIKSLLKPICDSEQSKTMLKSPVAPAVVWIVRCDQQEIRGAIQRGNKLALSNSQHHLDDQIRSIESYLRSR